MKSSRKTSLAPEWLSKVEAEPKQNVGFGSRQQEIIEGRPFGIRVQAGFQKTYRRKHSAIKFEDTIRLRPGQSLIPSCPLRRKQTRIFDNIVERASREMMPNLV